MKHTGIALQINDGPGVIAFDFGYGSLKGASSGGNSDVRVDFYLHELATTQFARIADLLQDRGALVVDTLDYTPPTPMNLNDLIEDIFVDTSRWHMLAYNCRHYVLRVLEVLAAGRNPSANEIAVYDRVQRIVWSADHVRCDKCRRPRICLNQGP